MSATKHHRIAQYLDGENPQRYRELMIDNLKSGLQHLSLVLNDSQFDEEAKEDKEFIVIPLGRTKTVPADSPRPTRPEEHANFTVPIIPKRYATSAMDKAQAAELREGWLYIYRNGYLWRELQVLPSGFLKDVNLRRYQGQHFRPATGEADSRVIVPWKIDNKPQTVEIAYSEVQWSWPRINAMGGMDSDKINEPRLNNGTPMPKFSPEETAQNRKGRMQDITLELEEWILTENNTLNIQSAEKVTAKIYSLQLHKYSKMPVVFLQDPLGMASENAHNYKTALEELTKLMEKISQKPFYKSAALAYPLFFDSKSAERTVQDVTYWGGTTTKTTEKTIFGKCRDKTNKNKLETLLEVTKRKELRAHIRKLKEIHVGWLQGKVNGQPVARTDFIDVNTALIDYFSNENFRYAQSILAAGGLLSAIDIDPCALDDQLNLSQDSDRPPYEKDPGCHYLESLLRPDHPLHAALFPTEQQAPVESDGPVQQLEEENDGMGTFRSAAYIAAFNGTAKVPGFLSQEARRTAEFIDQSLSDLVGSFRQQWKKAVDEAVHYDIKTVIRLTKASYPDDFVGLRFSTNLQEIPENRIITHANMGKSRGLNEAKAYKMLKASRNNPVTHKILDDAGHVLASDNPRYIAQYRGEPVPNWDWIKVKELKSRHFKTAGFHKANLNLTTIPEDCRLAWKLADMEAKVDRGVALKAGSLKALRKGIPPVVVMLEIWNLQSVVHAYKNSGKTGRADVYSAYADLSYATLQAIVEVAGEESAVARGIKAVKIPIGKGGLPALPTLGAVASFYSASLSLRDMLNNFDQHDNDAAIAHGIAAAGFTLFGLGLLGSAALSSKIACLAPLGVFAPYTWAALAVVLLGVAIAAAVEDKPLEEWAGNGPFCAGNGSNEFRYLREDEALAHAVLANCLFSPRIEMRKLSNPAGKSPRKGDIVVTVHLPKVEEHDVLDARACIEQAKSVDCRNGQVTQWGWQIPLPPYDVQPCITDGRMTALEYYFRVPDEIGNSTIKMPYRWQAKARLIMADGPILPDPVRQEKTGEVIDPKNKIPAEPVQWNYQKQLNAIDEEVPGWVYAKPLR